MEKGFLKSAQVDTNITLLESDNGTSLIPTSVPISSQQYNKTGRLLYPGAATVSVSFAMDPTLDKSAQPDKQVSLGALQKEEVHKMRTPKILLHFLDRLSLHLLQQLMRFWDRTRAELHYLLTSKTLLKPA